MVPLIGAPPGKFSKEFVSALQACTAAALSTIAHGLGVVPKTIDFEIECVSTGEYNWSVGDVLKVGAGWNADLANNRGFAIYADATNVYVRMGSGAAPLTIINKTTGAAAGITVARWNFRIRAWA